MRIKLEIAGIGYFSTVLIFLIKHPTHQNRHPRIVKKMNFLEMSCKYLVSFCIFGKCIENILNMFDFFYLFFVFFWVFLFLKFLIKHRLRKRLARPYTLHTFWNRYVLVLSGPGGGRIRRSSVLYAFWLWNVCKMNKQNTCHFAHFDTHWQFRTRQAVKTPSIPYTLTEFKTQISHFPTFTLFTLFTRFRTSFTLFTLSINVWKSKIKLKCNDCEIFVLNVAKV